MTAPILDFCGWLENLPIPTAIRESTALFPIVETVHVLALVVVIGSIVTVDLRLLGVANRERPVLQLTAELLPWTWTAFVVAAIAGMLLFSSKAVTYYGNLPFRVKMICLLMAGANMLWFHRRHFRRAVNWDLGPTPFAAKFAGALSLALWLLIVACGRWIGFTD